MSSFSILSSSVLLSFIFSLVHFVLQYDIGKGCYNAKLNSFFHMCPTALYSRHVVIHSFDFYIYGTIKYAGGRTHSRTIAIVWSDLGVLWPLNSTPKSHTTAVMSLLAPISYRFDSFKDIL